MEQNELSEWKQQKKWGVGFRVCWLLVPHCINQQNFLFPSYIFVHFYIPLCNSTKPINTLSARFLPVHQGSHRILLVKRFSSSSDLTGLGITLVVFCLFKGQILRKGKMMFKLTAAHTKSLVSSAESLAVNTHIHVSCIQGGIMSFSFPITYLAPLYYQLRWCLCSSTDQRYKC